MGDMRVSDYNKENASPCRQGVSIPPTIRDIIALKRRVALLEMDATEKKMEEWYYYALKAGLVETVYENGELVGFAEWIRLARIPNNMKSIQKSVDYNHIHSAPVLLISNVVATKPGIIWKLRKKVLEKNKDYKYIMWHRKKDDRINVIRRRRYV